MKAIIITALSAMLLAFGGCASVSPEDYAAAKERRAQRVSLCAQSNVFNCQTVSPDTLR